MSEKLTSTTAPPPALVFDLDGTLIDSAPDIGDAVNALLAEQGRRPLDQAAVRAMIGDGAVDLVRRAFAATGPALAEASVPVLVARYLAIYADHPVRPDCLYPGVTATLAALADAGHSLGLCTNKPERIARGLLAELGLARWFTVVLGAEVIPERKPSPQPLLWVTGHLGVSPGDAVMIGDSRNDVLSARAAGMPVVVVSYGYSKVPVSDLAADVVIDEFAALPMALAQVSRGGARPSR